MDTNHVIDSVTLTNVTEKAELLMVLFISSLYRILTLERNEQTLPLL